MARTYAEQMVHHLEPFLALGVVYSADIHDALELALGVIAKEGEDRDDTRRRDVDGQFILEHGELLNKFGETLNEVGAICMQGLRGCSVFRNGRVGRSLLREWRF